MSVERYRRLIRSLDKNTDERTIEWSLVGDSSTVQSRLAGYVIQIASGRRDANVPMIYVYLLNEEGDVVDTFSDEDISESGIDFYRTLKSLLEKAGRQANGADQALDAVLQELDDRLPL